jgi:adenine-specific DNA-methyltransferase
LNPTDLNALKKISTEIIPAPRLPDIFFGSRMPSKLPENFIYRGSCENFLWEANRQGKKFNLIFTSPPYNLDKPYTGYIDDRDLKEYLEWQEEIIKQCVDCLEDDGSICWQVGNYVNNGLVVPLDMELYPVFKKLGLKLRNRIVWHFGHGLHCSRRFSGRYEVVLWYTKTDTYKFNLDPVRIPSKYPNKKHFKGPKKGQLSGNPLGKNPADIWSDIDGAIEDVWDIPNVKHNHVEKTEHPCQFPVGLVMRFIKALTDEGDSVFDPFLGVGTTAASAAMWNRHFFGCELDRGYYQTARERIELGANGLLRFRDPSKPIYQPPQLKQPPGDIK